MDHAEIMSNQGSQTIPTAHRSAILSNFHKREGLKAVGYCANANTGPRGCDWPWTEPPVCLPYDGSVYTIFNLLMMAGNLPGLLSDLEGNLWPNTSHPQRNWQDICGVKGRKATCVEKGHGHISLPQKATCVESVLRSNDSTIWLGLLIRVAINLLINTRLSIWNPPDGIHLTVPINIKLQNLSQAKTHFLSVSKEVQYETQKGSLPGVMEENDSGFSEQYFPMFIVLAIQPKSICFMQRQDFPDYVIPSKPLHNHYIVSVHFNYFPCMVLCNKLSRDLTMLTCIYLNVHDYCLTSSMP